MSAIELAQQPDTSITHFGEAAEWTGVSSTTHREAWLEMRRSLVSASDVAAIMGEDPMRSALDVFADKTLVLPEPVLDLASPMFWGTVLEQSILSAVAGYHGWAYQAGGHLLRSRKHPHLGATLDAEINRGDGWIDFEGKTTRVAADWDEDLAQLPMRVLIQVQTQLLVTGAPSALVFALIHGGYEGLRPCTIEVHPSAKLHQVIVEVTEEFLERVRKLDPPPADSKSGAALAKMFPRDKATETAVQLPAIAAEWTREYQELGRQIKEMEDRRNEIKNLIKQSIGSAKFGILPEPIDGKGCWRWQQQKKAAYTVEESTYDVMAQLKSPPRELLMLPACAPINLLEQQLEASILPDNVTPIKPKTRRRARR